MAKLTKAALKRMEKECIRDKAPRDPKLVWPGDLVRGEDGSVHECLSRTECALTMKGVYGKGKNLISHWAPSAVANKITAEELEETRAGAAKLAAAIEDENRCPNCWPGDDDNDPARGRDTSCPEHIPTKESVRRAREGKRRAKFVPTDQEVARVLELRATGMGYQKIEAALGWPDSHGNKAWKIVKAEEKKGA